MTKQEKIANNNIIEKAWEMASKETDYSYCTRLRTCSAYVCETNNYYFLRSYNTIIAFIDKETDTCYDMLRFVYGYTSTSAQHIQKFYHDYGKGKWGCKELKTWLP